MNYQEILYRLFEAPNKSKRSIFFNALIYSLIIISIVNLMLISVPELNAKYGEIFILVRNIIMPIFVIEYLIRIYASGYLEEYKGLKGKLKYMITPYAIIDFLAILPYFLTSAGINGSFIRSLRLLRVFRLLRVRKYSIFIRLMKNIMSNIKEEITVLLFFTIIILIILSFIMFDVEHDAQPEAFSSIFATMWWSVATLTTVGYGDMYPITTMGKIITSIISIVGIGFVAIPGGLFASEFISEVIKHKNKKNPKLCTNCQSSNIEKINLSEVKSDSFVFNDRDAVKCSSCEHIYFRI